MVFISCGAAGKKIHQQRSSRTSGAVSGLAQSHLIRLYLLSSERSHTDLVFLRRNSSRLLKAGRSFHVLEIQHTFQGARFTFPAECVARFAKGNSYFCLVIDDNFITDSKATQTSLPSKSTFSVVSHQHLPLVFKA